MENQKEKKQEATTDTGDGSVASTTPLLDGANETVKRMEAAATRMENANARAEELAAKTTLGGRASAGVEPEVKEESDVDYAKRISAGQHERT